MAERGRFLGYQLSMTSEMAMDASLPGHRQAPES